MTESTNNANPARSGALGTFLLGFLCAAALVLVLRLDSPNIVHADSSSGGASGEWILVSGSDNEGRGTVWLFNANEQKLANYMWDREFLYFLGQRNVKYDFEIDDYNNERKQQLSSDQLKELIEKLKKDKEKRRK